MFNNVRNKIRYLTMGISFGVLTIAFFIIFLVMRTNVENQTKNVLNNAVNIIIKNPDSQYYKETEVMIFKLENNVATQYNDNYKKYSNTMLNVLYKECKELEDTPIKIGGSYFYYSILDLDGEYIYFVYDASLVMNNLNLLFSTLGLFFLILMAIISSLSFYYSNKFIDPLEMSYKSQKEFIENASHELKTPLTIINANVDSIKGVDDDNKKWIDNIKNQTNRMNSLVVEILELFRIDNQRKENNEVINLSNCLKKAILSFEVLVYEKNITFEQMVEENIIVKSTSNNVDKMVNILLDNALKYVNENGYIKINLFKEKKKTVLIVENSGGNLDKEDLDKIFDRFYKKNDQDKNSFGLGLAILKAIVDSMEGELSVESSKGEFTRFIVKI